MPNLLLSSGKTHPKSIEIGLNTELSTESGAEIFLQRWKHRFLQQCNRCGGSEKVADWIGGMGNHKDAFISLYANLLSLYALTQSHLLRQLSDNDNKVYLLEFAELRETIRPFLRNPLISNLYYLVIQSHEEMYGVPSAPEYRGAYSVWEGFDPYFLIR